MKRIPTDASSGEPSLPISLFPTFDLQPFACLVHRPLRTNTRRVWILLFAILPFSDLFAQWSTDPNNNLIVGYGQDPQLCSDGSGGCYITYIPQLAEPYTIRVVRLNRFGYRVWAPLTISGTDSLPSSTLARIVEDGSGGIIVAYLAQYVQLPPVGIFDGQSTLSSAYTLISRLKVQRIDSSGNVLWGPTGVRASLSETNQLSHAIVSDGQGGCIVAWRDTTNALRIQRVTADATRVWGDSGIYFYDDGGGSPVMASDLSGGVVMSWRYEKLQRLNPLGQKAWTDTGITVAGGAGKLRIDRIGQVYVVGRKFLGTINGELHFTVTMNKVDTSGVIYWGDSGVILDTAVTNNFPPTDFAVQNGYSSVARPENTSGDWDLRMQIVRTDGSTVFEYGGIPISRISSDKGIVGVLTSDSLTSIYVWGDSRTPGGIYAQRLDTLGKALWDTNDVALNLPEFGNMKVTTDGTGGCIGVGFHQFDFSIRALQVNKRGVLGRTITSANDVALELPREFFLYQNYPNPFNSLTVIQYSVPVREWISIKLYNLLGQQVRVLVDQLLEPGSYSVKLNSNELPSGVYFYQLRTTGKILSRKLTIVK